MRAMNVIIDEYNSGASVNKLCNKYKKGHDTIKKLLHQAGIIPRSSSESLKLVAKMNPRTLQQSQRDKISIARKKYLKENPDKVPYLLNHSSVESYPEKRFRRILTNIGLVGWIQHYQHSIYQYDFAFPSIKLDVEIDGNTHTQQTIIYKDAVRDTFSRNAGWEVIRFSAGELANNAHNCIDRLIKLIYRIDPEYDPYDMEAWDTLKYKLHQHVMYKKLCPVCTNTFYHKYERVIYCSKKCAANRASRNASRPDLIQLITDYEELRNMCAMGRKYGVSDNAVRKWFRKYGIDLSVLCN